MTFAEYNTDENFNKPSNAMELVKLGFNEGKTREEIENSLSPLWKEDKKGNVKKALDTYFKPTEETKIVEDQKIETPTPKADKATEFLNKTNNVGLTAENNEMENQQQLKIKRWNDTLDAMKKSGQGMKNIDDHYIEALPKGLIQAYKDKSGVFEGMNKKEAKRTLSYFIMDAVANSLKTVSNGLMAMGGKAPMFSDTTGDYEKIMKTNLAQGLENRWNKYKQDTQTAIDLVKDRVKNDEALNTAIANVSANNRLQTATNMMNEKQKVFTFQVLAEIGNNLGDMNNKEFVNTLMGMSAMGESLDPKEAAAMLVYRFGKDSDKVKDLLKGFGVDIDSLKDKIGDGEEKTAGFGGNGKNLKGYQTINGETVDFNMIENKEGKQKLRSLMDELSVKYYNGEIDADTFKKYYDPLYEESTKHFGTKSATVEELIEQNDKNRIDDTKLALKQLNNDAGTLTPGVYAEKYEALKNKLIGLGVSEKDIAPKLTSEQHLKLTEKAQKKNKKKK